MFHMLEEENLSFQWHSSVKRSMDEDKSSLESLRDALVTISDSSSSENEKMNYNSNTVVPMRKRLSNSEAVNIADLPPEIMQHILKFISYDNISKIRLVCKHFDNMCSSLLNSEFNRLRTVIQQRLLSIKSQMPRRESARRKHPLAREHDIIETLNMRLSLLHMTLGKHIERKYCCFFPGEIIDEVYRILRYIENTPCLNHGYKVTDELFDLSTMAMEYFKEYIEPRLPEITYFTPDFLEYPSLGTSQETQLVIGETIAKVNSRNIHGTPHKDPIVVLSKSFRKLKDLVKKNGQDIISAKHSLKLFKKKVNTLDKEVQQIKWQQKDSEKVMVPDVCKMNEVVHEFNRRKLEFEVLKTEISKQSSSWQSTQPHGSLENNDSLLSVKDEPVKIDSPDQLSKDINVKKESCSQDEAPKTPLKKRNSAKNNTPVKSTSKRKLASPKSDVGSDLKLKKKKLNFSVKSIPSGSK